MLMIMWECLKQDTSADVQNDVQVTGQTDFRDMGNIVHHSLTPTRTDR